MNGWDTGPTDFLNYELSKKHYSEDLPFYSALAYAVYE